MFASRWQAENCCSLFYNIEYGEFLLIKDQRDYHGRFKVYFTMSVAQFDASDTRATY